MRWAVLRTNMRTDERRVVRSYADHRQAEAAAARMNEYHREHKRTHLIDRAMTLAEAEAYAERSKRGQAVNTRRQQLLARKAYRERLEQHQRGEH